MLKKLPTCFYRGVHGINVSEALEQPFKSSYGRLPTFSDSPDIAQAYATESNDGDNIIESAVGMYRLEMKNPVFFPCRVSYQNIKDLLIADSSLSKDFEKLALAIDWFRDDEEIIGIIDTLELDGGEIYCTAFDLCDQPELIHLLKCMGYDSLLYEGDFTSSHLFNRSIEDVEQCSTFDSSENMAMEYRVFYPEQIKPYYEENLVDIPPHIRMLVNRFVDEYRTDVKNKHALLNGMKGQSGMIAMDLAVFLKKHKVPAKITLTQGLERLSGMDIEPAEKGKINNFLVHAAVSVDDLVIDLALSNLGSKDDPKYLSRQAHLVNWKWLISEKPPMLEIEKNESVELYI